MSANYRPWFYSVIGVRKASHVILKFRHLLMTCTYRKTFPSKYIYIYIYIYIIIQLIRYVLLLKWSIFFINNRAIYSRMKKK